MSIFAHVVSRSLPPEPAATRALEYVLGDPDALRAFAKLLAPIGVSFEAGHVEGEKVFGEVRPDLVVYDRAGEHRLLVENKFWAGLTPAQPVTYLDHLPDDHECSALVFVVPEERVRSVWAELTRRCVEAELNLADEGRKGAFFVGRLSGNRVMAVTDWRRVLDELAGVVSVRSDVQQLRALTERMDAEAFLPIRVDELTNVELARRLINYADLVEPIAEELVRRGVADTSGLLPSHYYHAAGRYLYMHGRLGVWLGVDLDAWRDAGTTPLWCEVSKSEWSGVEGLWNELDGMFDGMQVRRAWKCVPVLLRTGVERDAVIVDAVHQMVAIADRIVAALED